MAGPSFARGLDMKVAILDDYQNAARRLANWTAVERRAEITVFSDHLFDADAIVERLQPFDVVCVMRERTPLTGAILARLPKLKLIASTGPRNASIDMPAAAAQGIQVTGTGYSATSTVEMTWALILAASRYVVDEVAAVRAGGWQTQVGQELHGRTLGVLGLGNIGRDVARIGRAFGMKIVAWSENLTPEAAAAAGAEWVSREALFRQADILTVHLILSARSRGLVGAADLALMKPTARLVNTSRGPIVDEAALVACLRARAIAGAAVDVFEIEPLPANHPFRALDNLYATPHVGFVAEDLYRTFYGEAAAAIARWLEGQV